MAKKDKMHIYYLPSKQLDSMMLVEMSPEVMVSIADDTGEFQFLEVVFDLFQKSYFPMEEGALSSIIPIMNYVDKTVTLFWTILGDVPQSYLAQMPMSSVADYHWHVLCEYHMIEDVTLGTIIEIRGYL